MNKQFPYNPNQYYAPGNQCEYARMKKNIRNRGTIVLGDDRNVESETSYAEFFKASAASKPASQMQIWLEDLPKNQLDTAYKKAERKIGRSVVDGWEVDMRDKISMYSSGGSFFIRRAIKYFDRDG